MFLKECTIEAAHPISSCLYLSSYFFCMSNPDSMILRHLRWHFRYSTQYVRVYTLPCPSNRFLLPPDVNISTIIGCINKNTYLGDETDKHGFMVME